MCIQKIKNRSRILLLILSLFIIISCGQSKEKIAEKVKLSLQQKFDKDNDYKYYDLKVKNVIVLKKNDNIYQGLAEINYKNTIHEISLEIISDNDNLIWKIDLGSMFFLLADPQVTVLKKNILPEVKFAVSDIASILTSKESIYIENLIKSIESNKLTKIFVLTINSTNNEPIEIFSERLVGKWIKDNNYNGKFIFIIISKNDKKIRIEASENIGIKDELIMDIIKNQLAPSFKIYMYSEGIIKGIKSLSKLL
jgi:hypothetical protein